MITTFFCPRCQTPAVRMRHSGDFQHTCQGNEVLKNEDLLVIGDWEDYTGSDVNVSPSVIQAGQENKLQSTRAGLEGQKETARRTSRGFPINRYRTRQHIEYIPNSFFKVESIKMSRNPEEYTKDS